MPSIYTSWAISEEDDKGAKMRKLYLGIVSMGEDLYSFNAAISEMRKKVDSLDIMLADLQRQYKELKNE